MHSHAWCPSASPGSASSLLCGGGGRGSCCVLHLLLTLPESGVRTGWSEALGPARAPPSHIQGQLLPLLSPDVSFQWHAKKKQSRHGVFSSSRQSLCCVSFLAVMSEYAPVLRLLSEGDCPCAGKSLGSDYPEVKLVAQEETRDCTGSRSRCAPPTGPGLWPGWAGA